MIMLSLPDDWDFGPARESGWIEIVAEVMNSYFDGVPLVRAGGLKFYLLSGVLIWIAGSRS